ncbi:hypothetical protein [Streptomyces sp. NPDC056682]|uniref:hypothetical protein n=1 Tax=Streptomyces sp. NPDC056682 TaxID=3345909 RepID=UPI0036AC77A7
MNLPTVPVVPPLITGNRAADPRPGRHAYPRRSNEGQPHRAQVMPLMNGRAAMYRVTLRFVPGGPAVTGDWADPATAERKWKGHIGIYGSHPTAAITLTEQLPDGGWQTGVAWTRDGGEQRFAEDA